MEHSFTLLEGRTGIHSTGEILGIFIFIFQGRGRDSLWCLHGCDWNNYNLNTKLHREGTNYVKCINVSSRWLVGVADASSLMPFRHSYKSPLIGGKARIAPSSGHFVPKPPTYCEPRTWPRTPIIPILTENIREAFYIISNGENLWKGAVGDQLSLVTL